MAKLKEKLWEVLNLDYVHRRTRLRVARFAAYVVPAAAAALWLAAGVVARDSGKFSSGPVSRSHAPFESACASCHAAAWEGLARALEGGDLGKNRACLSCHGGTIGGDAGTGTAWHTAHGSGREMRAACASCHVEHVGAERLADVPDAACIRCHEDLGPELREGSLRDVTTTAIRLRSFAGPPPAHPDFRVLPDPGSIRFDHRLHLQPAGTIAAGRAAPREALACADCHRASETEPWRFARPGRAEPAGTPAAGGYMRPIRYAKHCAGCHLLTAGGAWKGEVRATGAVPDGGVPHDTPEAIRAYVTGKLAAPASEAAPERDLPFPAAVTGDPAARAPGDAVVREAERIEERLYRARSAVCAGCHALIPRPGGLPEVARSRIPDRWFQRATFNHDRHRSDARTGRPIDCLRCHAGVEESERSDTTSLPGVAACRACHGIATGAGASDRCTLCHIFHRPPR